MMRRSGLAVLLASIIFVATCDRAHAESGTERGTKPEQLTLVDSNRGREVPVMIYNDAAQRSVSRKLAIISHGYRMKNTEYSFVASYLATHGYLVASVQHELPTDEALPATGNPYETRMPSWQRGVENILFVAAELKKRKRVADDAPLLLVGHSHGGDTSMLFAQEHPNMVSAVISLDHRRMPVPRAGRVRILSLRSNDAPPDENVIPPTTEQGKLGIEVVNLPRTKHNEMWDGGSDEQKAEIIRHIGEFLRGSAK